jgi:hypothetical protein
MWAWQEWRTEVRPDMGGNQGEEVMEKDEAPWIVQGPVHPAQVFRFYPADDVQYWRM